MSNQEVPKEKKQNSWISFLKSYSLEHGIPYGSAISDLKCKEAYKNSKGTPTEPTVVEPNLKKPRVKKPKVKKSKETESVLEVKTEVVKKKSKNKKNKKKRNKEVVEVDVAVEEE